MTVAKDIKFTPQEMRQLLDEIEQFENEVIVPLSEEEVAEIEAAYQPRLIPADWDKRQRKHLEELRQAWVAEAEEINGLFQRAQMVGLSRKDLARRVRLGLDVLFKLDLRLIKDLPHRVFHNLADTLEVDARSIYLYLAQPPQNLEQMAASSKDKPAASRIQTWEEAISTSSMPEADKEFWLT